MLSCRPGFERLGNDGLASARFNAVVPEQAFVYVCSIAHARRHLGWLVIILCHMIYRQRLACGDVTKSWFRLPFATPLSLLVIAFLAFLTFLTVILGMDPDTASPCTPFRCGPAASSAATCWPNPAWLARPRPNAELQQTQAAVGV